MAESTWDSLMMIRPPGRTTRRNSESAAPVSLAQLEVGDEGARLGLLEAVHPLQGPGEGLRLRAARVLRVLGTAHRTWVSASAPRSSSRSARASAASTVTESWRTR